MNSILKTNPLRQFLIDYSIILCWVLLLFQVFCAHAQTKDVDYHKITLPNGWSLSPAGDQVPLGDLPLNIAVSPDLKYAAVTNNGQSKQSVQLIRLSDKKLLDTHEVGKSWLGLVFSDDGKSLYASGGNDNWIMRFAVENEKLVCRDTFKLGKPWPEKISVAGIAVDKTRHHLFAVTKENNSLYCFDIDTKKILKQITLGGEGYTCLLSPDMKQLFCSCWGCDKVEILNTVTLETEGSIPVGDNPNDMVIDSQGKFLYVANSNDNSVSVIDIKRKSVIETLNAALYPMSPAGSTTNSVALGQDDHTLYVANADNNCLAVFDVTTPGHSNGSGFIPTGWYPTCVRMAGKKILVANGKGLSSFPNPKGPNPVQKKNKVEYQAGDPKKAEEVQYIGGLFKGTLSVISLPENKQLSAWTQQVYANTPYKKEKELQTNGMQGNPVPQHVGEISPIKYVFYIVKENRTYDQVLGDMPQGNGDTSLVLFGKKYTPNQHALASEFVLLDNFYVDGEVSADGHNWSLGAYATDYLEKNWPTSYGGRGGSYDAEGTREIANNKNGFIWDYCKKFGVTYRTYGEFADNYKANIPVLEGHLCKHFTSWDQKVMDTTRFRQWKHDFDSLLSIHQLPQLNTLRFINDHTEGMKIGRPTPFAEVADNDLAVGLFVDYLSKSPVWNECAIFIVEDDAQNGPDHVDAHRSSAYVAGGFVKQSFVDHTPYSTSSFLRTIELILGLPPMSQYDAASEPLWRCFEPLASHPAFKVRPPQTDLFEKNTAYNEWQKKSEEFDFGREDRAPDQELNEVIWIACRGSSKPCPPPVHAAFVKISSNIDDD
ncbi:MAG: bifunctional YncE family protein/alkaline phosphatase family protein [Bacteroidia bacterium]|nr:bifunctional YncE family protein/alkaline phosphatase family protein [Bacteroidia bacterium]